MYDMLITCRHLSMSGVDVDEFVCERTVVMAASPSGAVASISAGAHQAFDELQNIEDCQHHKRYSSSQEV
ncbi:hypothetical protein BH23CHL2_BH23CHL2_27030 [soil metagenome]